MSWRRWVRQIHRWLSIVFTAAVVIVMIVAVGQEEPPEWVFFLPLPPLALLLFTGLNLFVLPYTSKRRRERCDP